MNKSFISSIKWEIKEMKKIQPQLHDHYNLLILHDEIILQIIQ